MSALFEERYGAVFGNRWEALRRHLLETDVKVWRLNAFCFSEEVLEQVSPGGDHEWAKGCVRAESDIPDSREPGCSDLETSYQMDLASVAVARALDVRSGMDVLDLCAAPGGKALVLAEALRGGGRLVANELSRSRRFKLMSVLDAYLPSQVRERVTVVGTDGARLGMRRGDEFDRVLVDVPCSAEGHLLRRPQELARWTAARSRQLARRQYALLCSALLATKVGGRLVYATCSLSPEENEGVVERFLHRKRKAVQPIAYASPIGEPKGNCWQVLPDLHGAGPSFFAVFQKI